MIHDRELKTRLQRLIDGGINVEDIARLYTGKRAASFGRTGFREIADFIAHPDLRNRGPIADRISDMRTTFKPLFDKAMKEGPQDINDILARAQSNFRMANDEQIAKLANGQKRQQAHKTLNSAVSKIKQGNIGSLTINEQLITCNFGDRLIWNPALRSQDIHDDFKYVMEKNKLVTNAESKKLDEIRSLIILHAISVMHGALFDLGDGITGELQAGFENSQGFLEITAAFKLEGYPKATSMKVGLLWTDLPGQDHVESQLIEHPGPWAFPLEIKNAQIAAIGSIVPKEETSDNSSIIHIG